MVGHRYWMPPPRQFQPMFQVFISNQLLCYIKSLCGGERGGGGGMKSRRGTKFLSQSAAHGQLR